MHRRVTFDGWSLSLERGFAVHRAGFRRWMSWFVKVDQKVCGPSHLQRVHCSAGGGWKRCNWEGTFFGGKNRRSVYCMLLFLSFFLSSFGGKLQEVGYRNCGSVTHGLLPDERSGRTTEWSFLVNGGLCAFYLFRFVSKADWWSLDEERIGRVNIVAGRLKLEGGSGWACGGSCVRFVCILNECT